MPQLLTKPAQKKSSRRASANGSVKVATPKATATKSPAPAKAKATSPSTKGKAGVMEKAAKTAKAAAGRRNRRSPVEILQELKEKRDRLHDSMMERLARLDERITKLENRHSSKIKVTELLQTHSTDELKSALDSLRKQRSLLRRALKDRLTT